MRILHTADWHLGKRLDFFSRIEEQRKVLQEICEIADTEQVDLILVAGDLFDTFNPTAEAVELLYGTLKKLTNNGQRPVIAIAGNHDSPDRIDAPDPLARACGIIFVGYPNAEVKPTAYNEHIRITQSDKGFLELQINPYPYPIRIFTMPYANELRLKQYLGSENREQQLNEILRANWKLLTDKYADDSGVNILVAHLYMLKRGGEVLEEPEGEKPIRIGNADLIYSDSIPSSIQYTALGHLHRFHQIGAPDKPVVYSGSPLAYSFAEAGQQKQVVIIDAVPQKPITYQTVSLNEGRKLFRKKFKDIDECVSWLNDHPETLVELTLISDTFLPSSELKRIHEAHDGIIHIIPIVRHQSNTKAKKTVVNLEQDMKQLFNDFFQNRYGQQPNEEILSLFNEVIHTDEDHD